MRVAAAALVALTAMTACARSFASPPGSPPGPPGSAVAVFAGGCFWCIEADLEKVPGVLTVVSGYTGGAEKNPTYKQVSAGATGHTEAVRVVFDPRKVSYAALVDYFWRHIDPTQGDGQFCDLGRQYRSGIFYLDDAQRAVAEKSKAAIAGKLPGPVVTEITKAGVFWNAEDYHQDYYKKSPASYGAYRLGCRRDARIEELWGSR